MLCMLNGEGTRMGVGAKEMEAVSGLIAGSASQADD